jgi:hypothetical protein
MGLLIAGVTGGTSLVDNAKITSLKREVDDHIRDVFTFYSRTGRLPGDLDNSGQIGWLSSRDTYPVGSFSAPYDVINNINKVSGPFIELYLYGISSFKPDPTKNGITAGNLSNNVIKNNVAPNGVIPTSKVYKNVVFTHRTELFTGFDVEINTKAINLFLPTDKKSANIGKKIDLKFDDGVSNRGNITAYCNWNFTTAYSAANYCDELYFYLEIK